MFSKLKALVRWLLPARLVGRIRAWRIKALVRGYHAHSVHHTYGGHELQVYLSDGLAAGWYDRDWPVLEEVRFLRQYQLRPGATVFDLGAHHGVVALMLSREVTASGRVIAVEANAHNAASAKENASLNSAENLVVLNAAVSDRSGKITFNEGLNGRVDDGTGEWGRVEVEAVTIDQLTAEYGPPRVLFIDVEGFECQALRGAKETLLQSRPDCFVEVHLGAGLEKFGDMNELLNFFPIETYALYYLNADYKGAVPIPSTAEELKVITERFFLIAVARG